MPRQRLVAVGLIAMVVLAGCSGAVSSGGTDATPHRPAAPESSSQSTIEVTGAGSAEGEPNRAVLRLGVVATADDAATARQRLAANVSRMRTALKDLGVTDDQITTTRYDIDRDYRRPRREDGQPQVQFRASHAFELRLTDLDTVGTIIDTAVQNGATEVNDIQFTLSTERRRQLEQQARRSAMADARQKAETAAAAANLTITSVKLVRVGGGAPRPSRGEAAATPTAAPAGVPDTDVEAGPVTVVATVHVVYNATAIESES